MQEELNYCEDCDKTSDETTLIKHTSQEQEYPGAYVWTFDYYLCKPCAKARAYVPPLTIRENNRGW